MNRDVSNETSKLWLHNFDPRGTLLHGDHVLWGAAYQLVADGMSLISHHGDDQLSHRDLSTLIGVNQLEPLLTGRSMIIWWHRRPQGLCKHEFWDCIKHKHPGTEHLSLLEDPPAVGQGKVSAPEPCCRELLVVSSQTNPSPKAE